MTRHILIVAAHPDDELLGPGATIARHVAGGDQVTIAICADGRSVRYDEELAEEVRHSCIQAANRLGVTDIRFGGMSDQRLDTVPIISVTRWVEEIVRDVQPEIIYTHHRGDVNRDHQVVYEATLTAARPYSAPCVKRILCYETPSATEWSGPDTDSHFIPTVYVDTTDHLESKLRAMSEYSTELRPYPHPRSLEALRIRAAHWGSVIGVHAAEAFMLVREVQ